MKKVRWGILGAANIAKTQIVPAILRASNAEVVAVGTSSDMEKANQFADEFSIPNRYTSYEEVLKDKDVDAVYIPLPNHLHGEWVKKAAAFGKHVLCEKPAAMTSAETKEMVEVCKKHGVVFMEAFMYQFHAQHERVKEMVRQGEIGDVRSMRAFFSFYLEPTSKNIRLVPEMGGGSLYDVGCYCIHVSRMIFGKEPVQVSAAGHISEKLGVDLTLGAILDFGDGVTSVIQCSFEQPFENKYEIIGTKGKIEVPAAFRPDASSSGHGEIILHKENGEKLQETIESDQYRLQIEHVSQAILDGKEPTYNGEETIKNIQVIEACLQSLKTKMAVLI